MNRASLVCSVLLALSAPSLADAGDCDDLQGSAQLECFRDLHPDTYERVEAACAGAERVRECRVEGYQGEGFTFVPAPARKKGTATSGASAPTKPDATAPTKGDAPPATKTKATGKPLDRTAVTLAGVGLTMAGTTLQQVPTLCASSPKCKLSPDAQRAVGAYGRVVATEASRIPQILGSSRTESAKVTALLGVLDGVVHEAPLGLGPEAQAYIDTGVTAARTVIVALTE